MKLIKIPAEKLIAAWQHWAEYLKLVVPPTNEWDWTHDNWAVFRDFLDPVRQFDLDPFDDNTEVNQQVANRIELLAGPHWYAYLKANEDRVEHAKITWGKGRG